jgi:hypothetical protein
MKRWVWALWLAALPARGEDPSSEAVRLEARMRAMKALVADLDAIDGARREDAATQLLMAGKEAIPYVLDAIHRKEAKLHLTVLEKLIAQESEGLPPELRIAPDDLKSIVDKRLGDPALAKDGKAFLYSKFLGACALFRAGRHEQALEIATAILVLEPRCEFADDLQKLRIACEEQQVQDWLVRTTASPSKEVYGAEELAKVTLTFTNMAGGNVEIWFGPPADRDVPETRALVLEKHAVAHIDISRALHEADGSFSEEVEQASLKLGRYSVALKPGESWSVMLDVDTMGRKDEGNLRIVTVRPMVRVVHIDGPTPVSKQRALRFSPAVIKVFPGDIKKAMENALQNLLSCIDRCDANSLFMFSHLMPEDKRTQAVEAVIKILKDDKWKASDRRIARNCLAALTGEAFATDEGWKQWYEEKCAASATVPEKR